MDPRPYLARAIIQVAIAATAITVIVPTMPVAAVEPAAVTSVIATPAVATTPAVEPVEPVEPPPPAEPEPVTSPAPPDTTAAKASGGKRHRRTAADRLIAVARRQLGDRYVYGATGPRRFDCSGLVLYALRHSHNRQVLRPGLRSARSFLVNFRHRDRAGRHHGHPGDLVVWGNGRHLGIYLGHGKAISALTRRGVRVHRLHAVTMRFTTFLHTRLWRHG